MRAEADFQEQIAGRTAAHARAALTRQANALAFDDAFRNRDLQRARTNRDAAVVAQLRRLELDRLGAAVECIFQIDLNLGGVILSGGGEPASWACAALTERTACAEQR